MPRPSTTDQRRRELVPVVARTFAELGYRRTTTAELASRCSVRENVLYRLWPDKKAMFIGAIEHVYERSAQVWAELLRESSAAPTAARRLLDHESEHHGEFGLYRIVFAGLSETDDVEIRSALAAMYRKYHRFIQQQIGQHRSGTGSQNESSAALTAWAVIGLGTVANIGRELGLLGSRARRQLMRSVGLALLGDGTA